MNTFYKTGYEKIDGEFVRRCDYEFDEKLNDTVARVCGVNGMGIMGITGPSCSGKTTLAKKVIDYYKQHNTKVHVISLDDFFKDQFSKDDYIDPKTVDFDSPDTFDTEEFYSFIDGLFRRGVGEKPIFEFGSGDRSRRECVVYNEGDVCLFEGIQLLYPQVDELFVKMSGKRIFICPESGIKVGDVAVSGKKIRLMRRLVRDCNFRASDPIFTLDLWSGVRKNEDLNIFPYIDRCDAKIDTTQAYELNILKPYILKIVQSISDDSEHSDFKAEINELTSKIDSISRDVLDKNSLYNEFV